MGARGRPALAAHPPPEILQADLSALRLAMAVWGARRIEDLAWVDAPPRTAFRLAEETLATLGALDAEGQLTPLGRRMARLGVAPRLSAMLCGVGDDGDKVLAGRIAAVLSEDAGGRDIDLRFRVEKAMESRPVRALAERLARMAGAADGAKCAPPSRAGRLLALAYPGRVARRRRADEGVYQSVDGQGARLDAARGLAGAEWIVIADAQGAGADLRVRLAAPIGEEDVLELFGERAEHSQEVSFDAGRGRVVAEPGLAAGRDRAVGAPPRCAAAGEGRGGAGAGRARARYR